MSETIKKSAVIEAQEKITAILTGRKNVEQHIKEVMAADETAQQKAEEEVRKAVASSDLDAYQKAKKALQTANDSREMHTAWAETVRSTPAITGDEYDAMVRAIYAELDALEDTTMQKLVKLAGDMAALGDQLKTAQNDANVVLEKLQHDVYLDADRRRAKNGEVLSHQDAKVITKWDTINYAMSPTQHYWYDAYMKKARQ